VTEPHDQSAIDQITHGDERLARHLRGTLAVIARRTDDPSLRQLVVNVLAGRESVRRVYEHPSFWAMATKNFENLEAGIDRLTDEEREMVRDKIDEQETPDDEVTAMQEGRDAEPPPPPSPKDIQPPGRWG